MRRVCGILVCLFLICLSVRAADSPSSKPIALQPGPHLFVDDLLIEKSTNLTRKIQSPPRDLDRPVVTGKEDKNFQPYVSVLRDPKMQRFRIWYNVAISAGQSHLGYLESEDGVVHREHSVRVKPGRFAVRLRRSSTLSPASLIVSQTRVYLIMLVVPNTGEKRS